VVGGMLAATFLAVFFIPLFFHWVSDRRLRARQDEIDSRPHEHGRVHVPSHHPAPRPPG
jgi:HAE1 family hydrophobic/amphiphilic exporter-1/multidrug efflux pump